VVELRQRVAIDVDNRSLSTTIIGETAALPIAIAPIGLCGMMHGDGDSTLVVQRRRPVSRFA
jgi:L-lactate dehydrogenase (cytochrome)